MKGAISLPMTIMVAIIIAVLVIIITIVGFGGIPSLVNKQALDGAYSSCCTDYQLAGHCEEGKGDLQFSCSVPKEVKASGTMSISELAIQTGVPIENRCCPSG
jgi:hypothetical protein